MRLVDPGVEQRDRDATAVVARQLGDGPVAALRPELVRSDQRLGRRSREGSAHRVDPGNFLDLVEQRDRTPVERRRETVQYPRVAEVRADRDALRGERRQNLLLRGKRLR
jgi:hypothetical protein